MHNILDKHPPSLKIFFATEMWERYGFYVVQSLLALYLALHYQWPDKHTYALVGSFTAMTYLSPVIGGWIADHLLGQKKTILLGAVILFYSYLTLSFINSKQALLAALAGIAVGTGLLKPNISSLLGNEYSQESPGRESGFTIFYMGITTGIILGTTLPSQLNYYFGWSVSFASAAIGMTIAFTVFAFGIKRFQVADYHPITTNFFKLLKALGLISLLWVISFFILFFPRFADFSFLLVLLGSLSYLIYSIKRESPKQARQTAVIGLLCIISVLFWAFYFQMFLSLTLFISRLVEPKFFGIQFPAPYYVGVQSVGMLIFGYLLTRKKSELPVKNNGISTANKFLLSMLFMLLSYALITFVSYSYPDNHLLSPLYFIPAYLLISLAELLLSPVGLAAITLLASRKKVSTMMGIFFVSLGLGGFLAGKLATISAIDPKNLSVVNLKLHYLHAFSQSLVILIAATLICGLLNLFIKKLLAKDLER